MVVDGGDDEMVRIRESRNLKRGRTT